MGDTGRSVRDQLGLVVLLVHFRTVYLACRLQSVPIGTMFHQGLFLYMQMTNAHCCFQTVKTLRNYVSILKVHIAVLYGAHQSKVFRHYFYLPTPVFVFVFQGNAQKMQQYKLVTCPSATQQIHLLRASTQELLHHPVLRPECKMYFCRNISNYIDVLCIICRVL